MNSVGRTTETDMEQMTSTTAPTMNCIFRKEYGLNQLTPFTGDRMKIQNFVQECAIYLAINEAVYNNKPSKVAFVLSFLTDNKALKWKERYI